MRLFCFVAILVVAFPGNAFAQVDPNWSQREMERMQAQQERWDAQAERQRAEQERWAAQAERQRVQQERERDQGDRQSQQHQTVPPSPEQTPAAAGRPQPIHTGNDLYRACTPDGTGNTTPSNLQCMIYIGDVSFGGKVVKFQKADGGNCFPQGVDLGQIQDIVFAYLRQTPERRHINATNLTVEAIIQAFPACKVTAVKR